MKRFLALTLTAILLFSLCMVFSACGKGEPKLSYGEKYIRKMADGSTYTIVLNKNGTGKFSLHREKSESKTFVSAEQDFLWTITSDNTIHMVADGDMNHDEGSDETISSLITKCPISFSEDLLYYNSVSGGSLSTYTSHYCFLRQGSKLYDAEYVE